jgi:dethiobiotin synthetase
MTSRHPQQKQICPATCLDPPAAIHHLLPMSYFVTGTDTGVGKTHVTRLILQAFRQSDIDAVGYKPVSCGDRDDARILAAASGNLPLDDVNPHHLQSPLSPHTAGLLENRTVDPAGLLAGFRRLAAAHPVVIVEGVGGWEVPLTDRYRVSDLAADLALPVILVAANRLGALNHILLTLDAIHAKGLTCAGIILNQLSDEMDTAMISNKSVLAGLTAVPLLDHLIFGQDFLDDSLVPRLAEGAAAR